MLVEGVVADRPEEGTEGRWYIGRDRVCVYSDVGTRLDNSPTEGSLVTVIGIRWPEGGPILAERIINREPGQTFAVGSATVAVEAYTTGGMLVAQDGVWRVKDDLGADHFFSTAGAEIDPSLAEGDQISVEFLVTGP